MKNATYKNGKYYWADPEKMFTGNPAGTLDYYKNWGIYPKGILPLAKKYRSGAVDISKQGVSKIESEIRSGNPVIVWATVDFKNPYGYFSWTKPDGKKFTGYRNYHVMLVTGVSSGVLCLGSIPWQVQRQPLTIHVRFQSNRTICIICSLIGLSGRTRAIGFFSCFLSQGYLCSKIYHKIKEFAC
ncbi:C39 family peptidase [Exiguobacterium sp. SL14]|nr:C39 family peptidase [Exiguobacterium sp. SL14]MCY1691132.1 C39 family peptidase [Exiguobacterium sp. SL14]